MNGDESYVLLGGYGHWRNPYTHFFHRGYGEVFERQMGKECYSGSVRMCCPISFTKTMITTLAMKPMRHIIGSVIACVSSDTGI